MLKEIIVEIRDKAACNYIAKRLEPHEGVECEVKTGRHYVRYLLDFSPEYLYIVKGIVLDCLLLLKKLKYLALNTKIADSDYPMTSLLCSLVYFEHTSERSKINKLVMNTRVFNITGLYNFRMQEIIDGWQELVDITLSLMASGCSDSDVYNVTTFMMAPNSKPETSIFIADIDNLLLTNLSVGGIIDIQPLFESPTSNLIAAIASQCPAEVVVESGAISDNLLECLKSITKLKTI